MMQTNATHDYHIEKGKTKDATRNVPIPNGLVSDILTLRHGLADETRLFSVDSKAYSRWFSIVNTSVVDNNRKAFHSLRVCFATALKLCDVPERHAAEILGHKRGDAMPYGYYAKENEIKVLAEQCAKAVAYINKYWLSDSES